MPDTSELDSEIIAEGATEGNNVISHGISALENQQTYTNGESVCNAEAVDGALVLRAFKHGEYACAIIGQIPGSELRPIQVQVQTETSSYGNKSEKILPLRYWIGIADFTYGSWRWFGTFTENHAMVTVNSESLRSRVKSAANNVYVCVLTGIGNSSIETSTEGVTADFPLDFSSPESPSNVVVPVGVAVRAVLTTLGEGLDTLPAQLTGLSASSDESAVHLSWETSKDPGVQVFKVIRDDPDDEEEPMELGELTPTTTEYDDETGIPGKEYEYSVLASNDVGVSGDAIITGCRALAAPTAKASDTVPDRIAVSWRASEGAVGYRVLRAESSEGTPESVAEVAGDKFGWDDQTAETGKAYWYWVQALGEDFDSALGLSDSGICQDTDERVWWMYGRNEKHNGRSPYIGPQNGGIKWRHEVGAMAYASVVLGDNGRAYIGTATSAAEGSLYSVNPDGTIAWTYDTGVIGSTAAIAADGTVFAANSWGTLYALYPSGELKWVCNTGILLPESPAIGPDGTVYIVGLGFGGPCSLFAIDPSTGAILWEYSKYWMYGVPTIAEDGTIYVGDDFDTLHAVNPDGTSKWECDLPSTWTTGNPSLGDDGTIYVVGGHRLYAVADNGDCGEVKWQCPGLGSWSRSSGVGLDGVIYVTNDDSLLAIRDDGTSGTLLWSYGISRGLSYGFSGEPAIGGDGTIYVSRDRYVYAFTPDGLLVWTCAVGGAVEGGPSLGADGTLYVACNDGFIYALDDGPNTPPQADVSASPVEGDASLTVSFDASASYDPDGSVIEYRWDWDEGWYKGSFFSSGENPLVSHEFEEGGEYRCRLHAIDDKGAIGEASIDILVHGWGLRTIDWKGGAGRYCSLEVVNGSPAISYYGNGDLKYVRASDASGGSWDDPVTVDGAGASVGYYSSLAVVNGHPAVSYLDITNDKLKYVRANDANGTSWDAPVTVDSVGDVSWFAGNSLACVDGKPAIAYYEYDNDDLKYIRADDANGSCWGTAITVDNEGGVGLDASLAVVNGYPAVSYYDGTNRDLKYARATNASGSTWATPVTVDSTRSVGRHTSLAVVDGKPAISYFDYTHGDLKYIRANDTSGSSWDLPLTVDSEGEVGGFTSIAVLHGIPAIAYYDYTNGDLKYVQANDAVGTTWGPPEIVDSEGDVGTHASLADVDGNPAISYFEGDYSSLKYSRLY
ncbi:PQQ-binding-like beta-propeller repeat protein [bacterium]|nr:PQQ-binding-like beta-propeller repeat protein [bacterium]